ncbi:TlpA disulfide reductase family protein [Olivibacter sp. XZL3]|uniref:TlpA disulfide reductase family protein n=1 Tax=Olivibacter sp. XZL3 TaxID=1735116 RepID=UPI0010666A0C|nr:TlpA disulfide reductase family protein [Olivibacter sp. XZL3]
MKTNLNRRRTIEKDPKAKYYVSIIKQKRYMKNLLTVAILFSASIACAQQRNLEDRAKAYYDIIQSGTKEQKEELSRKLLQTARTAKSEKELQLSINYLNGLGKEDSADSLIQVVAKRFPKGEVARDQYISNVFHKQDDATAMEKCYAELIRKWPRENFKETSMAYEYAIAALSRKLAEQGQTDKAIQYLDQMQMRFWRAQGYSPVAAILLEKGDTATAVKLIQTAIDDAEYFINLPEEQKNNETRFAAVGYPGYVAQMVSVYDHQGKQAESLALVEKALQLAPDQAPRFSRAYYTGLEAAGRKLEALQQLEMLYKQGDFTFKDKIKELYTSLNGSSKGLDGYLTRMDEDVIKSIREHIAKMATYKDAPDFELLNLRGEKVSLADMRGKVVVLDFWATWCQPCIRSFPGMKAAQEHYADDNEVQFLFMNTWERTKGYKANVAAFIEKNNYPFEVLFDDQKDSETGENLAAKFGVQGIPAKFILDKEGKIRFSLMGSNGNSEYTKMEMIELIESARKPHKG